MKRAIILTVALLLFAVSSQADTLYVTKNGVAGTGDWSTPYSSINAAISASSSGDEIWIRGYTDGTTYPENLTINSNHSGISIRGGYTGNGSERSESYITTVFPSSGTVITASNISASPVTLVEYLTIKNGYYLKNLTAGGINCISASPTIRNCHIYNCGAEIASGICADYNSSPTIEDCEIDNNFTDGGQTVVLMYNGIFRRNKLHDNDGTIQQTGGLCVAPYGSGVTVSDNHIYNNTAMSSGAGIYIDGNSVTLTGNIIENNSAYYGNAVYWSKGADSGSMCNNVIKGNNYGASAVYIDTTASTSFVNNTIIGNTGDGSFRPVEISGGALDLYNNIIANNSNYGVFTSGTIGCSYNNCLYNNGTNYNVIPSDSQNPVTSSPSFCADGHHLSTNSLCIDVGYDNAPGLPAVDLDGESRQIDIDGVGTSSVDIGADEYSNTTPTGSIIINDGDACTPDADVELTLSATDSGSGVYQMQISNYSNFYNATWEAYSETKEWTLSSDVPGIRTVYVKYKNYIGNISQTYSDTIFLGDGGQVYCVSEYGDDENDGKGWGEDHSLLTIQAALALVQSGDEIWVSRSNLWGWDESIALPSGVGLYGGFYSDDIDGDHSKDDRTSRPAIQQPYSYLTSSTGSVITVASGAGADTVIDGFVIKGFSGTLISGGYYGMGIYCSQASPTISNNVIYNNDVDGYSCYGGAICCFGGSPHITNNVILSDHTVSSAGVWCSGSELNFINNTVISNKTTTTGGGLYLDNCTGDVANNIVFENSLSGVHTVGENYPYFSYNCVYRNGALEDIYNQTATTNYTGVMADPVNTNGNISQDPLFLGYVGYGQNTEYRLSFLSPCIDMGDDTFVDSNWLDVDRKTRQFQVPLRGTSLVDIGAYEYVDTTSPTINWVKPEGMTSSACTCSTSQLYAQWNATDAGCGISECQYAIGESATYPPATYIVEWTSSGVDYDETDDCYSVRKTGLTLVPGNTYYFYIKVIDAIGNESSVSVAGVTIGCSNPTIEDALRCADDDIISCTLDYLIVTAGTSQFNANSEYHMYVRDSVAGRINTSEYYGLRVDFENGTPTSCDPGDYVSIKGRMDTADSGERVMIIDLNDQVNYYYAVTEATNTVPVVRLDGLYNIAPDSYLTLNGITLSGVATRPVGGNANTGKLASPYDSCGGWWSSISYVPSTGDFFYLDDTSVRYYGRDSESNHQYTDGNGLDGGVCAEGVRVDYSWMGDSLPSCGVGSYVKVTGICATEDILDYNNEHQKVRVLRLREYEDLQVGPTITSPAIDAVAQSSHPTIEFSSPINLKNHDGSLQASHQFIQLCITMDNYPTDDTYSAAPIIENATNSVQWPSSMEGLRPGIDYYAFVRVTNDTDYDSFPDGWSPWSKLGHKFRVAGERLLTPVHESTIWDDTPLISWKYDSTTESGDTFNAKVTSVDEQTTYWSDSVTGDDNLTCTTLSPGTYLAQLKKSTEVEWEIHTFEVHTDAPDAGQIETGSVEYTYDRYGNLETMVDWRGTTTYYYDGLNRLVKTHLTSAMQEWNGQEVIYKHGASTDKSGYDLRGNRTKMTTVSLSPSFSHPTKYEYTDLGQLAKLTDQLDGVTSYEYDNMGLVQTTTYPNGTYTTYEYDSDRYWLTNITHKKSNQTVIGSFTYGYNTSTVGKNGTRTSVSEYQLKPDSNNITATVAYTYDDLYRLSTEVRTGDVPYSKSYYYDLAGNRTSMVDGATTTTCTYDAANKLLSAAVTGGSTTYYKYDGAGNQRTATTGSDVTTYTWGFKNMMTKWEKTGETTVEFGYDGRGMRVVSAPSGGTATRFMLDRKQIAEEINGSTTTAYVGPWLIGKISGTTCTFYHADGLGSTRAISNVNQVVTQAVIYDAYGDLQQDYPTGSEPNFGFVGQFRYYADATGLDYLKARYYDPIIGRFISRDPIGYRSDLNIYAYVGDKPTTRIDPTGKAGASIGQPSYNDQVKVCFRDLDFGLKHIYFLVGGSPIGYGPGGVDMIDGDIDDIENGRADCTPLSLDPCQRKCMESISNGEISVPGNWDPGSNLFGYIPGLIGRGSYNFFVHNCYDWANGALKRCGINRSYIPGTKIVGF